MTFTYPDPITNSTKFSDLLLGINTATDGFFGIVIIISIYVICMISMSKFGFIKSFAAASFVSLVLCGPLLMLHLLPQGAILLMIFLNALSVLLLYLTD